MGVSCAEMLDRTLDAENGKNEGSNAMAYKIGKRKFKNEIDTNRTKMVRRFPLQRLGIGADEDRGADPAEMDAEGELRKKRG